MQATAHLINLFVSPDKHFKGQLSTEHSVWQVDDKVDHLSSGPDSILFWLSVIIVVKRTDSRFEFES